MVPAAVLSYRQNPGGSRPNGARVTYLPSSLAPRCPPPCTVHRAMQSALPSALSHRPSYPSWCLAVCCAVLCDALCIASLFPALPSPTLLGHALLSTIPCSLPLPSTLPWPQPSTPAFCTALANAIHPSLPLTVPSALFYLLTYPVAYTEISKGGRGQVPRVRHLAGEGGAHQVCCRQSKILLEK